MFTIFSPRIDNYTLGVTPGEGMGRRRIPPAPMVELGRRTARRAREPAAAQLPLPRRRRRASPTGWRRCRSRCGPRSRSSRNWSAAIDPARFDPDPTDRRSALEHPPATRRPRVIGTFVNRLPVPVLSDCVVFYAGQAYPAAGGGTIRSGETIRLVLDSGTIGDGLAPEGKQAGPAYCAGRAIASGPRAAGKSRCPGGGQLRVGGPLPLLGFLFHEASLDATARA